MVVPLVMVVVLLLALPPLMVVALLAGGPRGCGGEVGSEDLPASRIWG